MQNAELNLKIEVVYALINEAHVIPLEVADGCTIEQAIRQSTILNSCPEIDLSINKVGVFNKVGQLDDPVRNGDRVEIYRPLLVEPKEARRRRAKKQKTAKN
jgi:uncharacterized protein